MLTVTEEHNTESKDEADERPEQKMFGQKIPQMKKRIKAEVDKDI